MLAKQRLLDIGGDPFNFSIDLAMAAVKRFSVVTVCFFVFGPCF
jgi:hypothetical protein